MTQPLDPSAKTGTPTADDSFKEEVFGAFLEELEAGGNLDAVVARYIAAHPQWENEFREEAALTRMLQSGRHLVEIDDPTQFPDFQILRRIAAGGMGTLYEAVQLSLRRRVALKVRHGHYGSPLHRDRFEREQRILAKLHQSHIVPIHASGQAGRWQYFAMTYIDGVSLHDVVVAATEHVRSIPEKSLPAIPALAATLVDRRNRGLPTPLSSPLDARQTIRLSASYFRSVAEVLADAAEALQHAHSAGIVHRDIKPSNILVDLSGQCWLIDFGLASVKEDAADRFLQTPEARSTAGETAGLFGTPEYMPPERIAQVDGAGADAIYDPRSDIWSLGVTLYELLTLRRPFNGSTTEEIFRNVDAASPPSIRSLTTNVPLDLAAICGKALRKSQDDRYATARDAGDDLRRWLNGEPTKARPASAIRSLTMWAKRHKARAAAILLATLSAALGVFFFVLLAYYQRSVAEQRAELAEEQLARETQKAQLERREALIRETDKLQFVDPQGGWSETAWLNLQQAYALGKDARLRSHALGVLFGLDVRLEAKKKRGASFVAWDEKGSRLITDGVTQTDGKAPPALWNVAAGDEQRSSYEAIGPVRFASDGQPVQLIADVEERTIVLRDPATGQVRKSFRPTVPWKRNDSPTLLLSAAADLAGVAIPNEKGFSVEVWRLGAGEPILKIPAGGEVLAFSPDSTLIAIGDNHRQKVDVYSLPQGERLATTTTGAVPVRSLEFRPAHSLEMKSSHLAVGDAGGSVTLLDWKTGKPVNFFRGSTRDIYALAFSPDGTLLATTGRDEIRLWDAETGRLALRFRDSEGMDYIVSLAFSPDGSRLAAGSKGVFYPPSVTVWQMLDNRGIRRLVGMSGQVEKLTVSADGRRLAALSQSWDVGVWNLDSGRLLRSFKAPVGEFSDNAALEFDDTSEQLIASAGDMKRTEVRLWRLADGKEVRRWTLPPGLQNHACFADGGLWHFQVEVDGADVLPVSDYPWKKHPRVCRIRNLLADPSVKPGEIRDFTRHVFFSAMAKKGPVVAIDGLDANRRYVKAFDCQTGKTLWTYDSPRTEKAGLLMFDPSGDCLSFTAQNGSVSHIVDARDGSVRRRIPNAAQAIFGAGTRYFSTIADGRWGGYVFFPDEDDQPMGLSKDVMTQWAVFDRSGDRVFWGGVDGAIRVANLRDVRSRLATAGFLPAE